MSFPLTFSIDAIDCYTMSIEINYNCKLFVEQYNLQVAASRDNTQWRYKSKEYEVVDPSNKFIIKKQAKNYAFNAISPLDIKKRYDFIDNSFFVQLSIENKTT